MPAVKQERRDNELGSIVCENGALRLRVTQENHALTVVVDAMGAMNQWGPLALRASGADVCYADASDVAVEGIFSTFDPFELDEQTRGVVLHGHLGDVKLTSMILLQPSGPWFTQRLQAYGDDLGTCRRLTQRWRLAGIANYPEVAWPHTMIRGAELVGNPTAFLQEETSFAALLPEGDEEDLQSLILTLDLQDAPRFEFGLWPEQAHLAATAVPSRLQAQLCLDARALNERGFQHVVRLLGNREGFTPLDGMPAFPDHATLPALPCIPEMREWHPFMWEGSPAAMASLVDTCFQQAEEENGPQLEQGLVWLDRLCLHQHAIGVPGESSLGSVGNGPQWSAVAVWLPVLLLRAYRFTGIPEYACRGLAALRALPRTEQAAILQHLQPTFGDLYINAIFQEVLPLRAMRVITSDFTPDSLNLHIDCPGQRTLRIVLEGLEEQYSLTVNGCALGHLPLAQLRAGIDVDINTDH